MSDTTLVDREAYRYGGKFASVIVNVGTKTVQQVFYDRIKGKAKMCASQHKNPVQGVLQIHEDKICNIVPKWQHKIIFDGKYDYRSYDLTVLISLFSAIPLIRMPPKDRLDSEDKTLGADLQRLKNYRNESYAHLVSTLLSASEYEVKINDLESILKRLGAKDEDIAESKQAFEPTDVDELIKELKSQLAKDHFLIEDLALNMQELYKSNQNRLQREATNFAELQKLQEQVAVVAESSLERSSQVLQFYEMFPEEIRRQSTSLLCIQDEIALVAASIAKVETGVQNLQSKLDNATVIAPVFAPMSQELLVIKQALQERQNSLKILILTGFHSSVLTDSYFYQFGEDCGSCRWDMIIDLNHHSQSKDDTGLKLGIFDAATKVMQEQSLTYKTVTYAQLENLSDIEKRDISGGRLLLWIMANGTPFSQPLCEPSEEFSEASSSIRELIFDVLLNMETKPLVIACVLSNNSEEDIHALKLLMQGFKENCNRRKKNILVEQTYICSIFPKSEISEKWKLSSIFTNQDYCVAKCAVQIADASLAQIGPLLNGAFGVKIRRHCYEIPTKDVQVPAPITSANMAIFQPTLQVYYLAIGLDLPEDQIVKCQSDFLSGKGITPQALRLHDKQDVFVPRKEMREIKDKIKEELEKRNQFSNVAHGPKGYFKLFHEPSAGGTTCGRYVLFELRNSYPCIEILRHSVNVAEHLAAIHGMSRKPLLVMLDADVSSNSLSPIELQRELENAKVRALIVHVIRVRNQPTENQDLSAFLPAAVHGDDLKRFKNLYQESSKLGLPRTVFQFGLYNQPEVFTKLASHVKSCVAPLNERQLSILRALCFMRKYCDAVIERKIVLSYLQCKTTFDDDALDRELDSVSEFVVTELVQHFGIWGCKLAHNCLVKPFLECIAEKTGGDEQQLQLFLDTLKEIVENDYSKNKSASFRLIFALFIDRAKLNCNPSVRFVDWTLFVDELGNKKDDSQVPAVLLNFVKYFSPIKDGPHLRAVVARYYSIKLKDMNAAIREIKVAVGLKPTEKFDDFKATDDNQLLNLYATLQFQKARENFFSEKDKHADIDGALRNLCSYLDKEVFSVLKKAQKSTNCHTEIRKGYNPHPFSNEAKYRAKLLTMTLQHKFKGNIVQFSEYIRTVDLPLLRDSQTEANRAIEELEFYINTGRILDKNPEQTARIILETKWALLHCPVDKRREFVKNSIPDDIPCDVGGLALNIYECSSIFKLPESVLKNLYEKFARRINNRSIMLSRNYKDLILVMIVLRRHKENAEVKYSGKFAVETATRWTKQYPDSYEAHFMLGAVMLVSWLDSPDESLQKGLQSLERCKEVLKEKSVAALHQMRFYIEDGKDIARLKEYDKNDASNAYQWFSGRQVKKDLVEIEWNNKSAFRAKIGKRSFQAADVNAESQQRLMKFHLALGFSQILAVNCKYE